MKKVTFTFAFVATIASIFISSNYQANGEQINNLLLENIECLSSPEIDIPLICIGIGSLDCPNSYNKVIYIYQ